MMEAPAMCTARGRCYGGGLLILLAFACLFCANGFTPMVLLNPARPQVYPASASSAADASSWCSLSRPVGRVRLPREELVPNYRAHARGISLKMQERGGNRAGRGRRGGRGGARSSSAGGERGPRRWLDDLDAGKAGRKRPDFARLRKESNREAAKKAGGTDWASRFDSAMRQKKMDLSSMSIEDLENRIYGKVMKKKYADEDEDEPFVVPNMKTLDGADQAPSTPAPESNAERRQNRAERADKVAVNAGRGRQGVPGGAGGGRSEQGKGRGVNDEGQKATGKPVSWAKQRAEALQSLPRAVSRADLSGASKRSGKSKPSKPPAQVVAVELLQANKVPALRASLEDEDDAEERALDLFSAWKAKKTGFQDHSESSSEDGDEASEEDEEGRGGREGREGEERRGGGGGVERVLSGGIQVVNTGASDGAGLEIDEGIMVVSRGGSVSTRPANVDPEWLLDLDTNPEWLADVEIDDDSDADGDKDEDESEEEEEEEEEEDSIDMEYMPGSKQEGSRGMGVEGLGSIDPDDEMDEDDREFFRARGLLKDVEGMVAEIDESAIDRVLISKDEAVSGDVRADFEELGVSHEALLDRIEALGFRQPTKIQEATVPQLLAGRDIVLHAHTGSGKTLAFLLPILQQILSKQQQGDARGSKAGGPVCLVIAPSRELAIQILKVAEDVVEGTGLTAVQLIGGANVNRQQENLRKKKPEIIIGTPGRLAELALEHGSKLKLSNVQYLVVDEVDQCLKAAMKGDVDRILTRIPANKRQTVFASATGNSPQVVAFADKHFGSTPLLLDLGGLKLPEQLVHAVVPTPRMKKIEVLRKILNLDDSTGALVFVNDQRRVGVICDQLYENGIIAAPLTGEESRDDRREVMRRLREGRLGERPIVVCTEIAARGIDVPGFNYVVNLDLPTDADHYVHRAGRTARGGREGTCIILCEEKEYWILEKFEKALNIEMREAELFEGRLLIADPDDEEDG